jgi:hypothetical protein
LTGVNPQSIPNARLRIEVPPLVLAKSSKEMGYRQSLPFIALTHRYSSECPHYQLRSRSLIRRYSDFKELCFGKHGPLKVRSQKEK